MSVTTRKTLARFTPIVLSIGLIALSALAVWGTRPPPVVDASAAANSFSAARSISHLTQIAKQPRPIGSDEVVRVREYLVEQLRILGAEVHIEQATGIASYGRTFHAGLVNNIVATFPGSSNTRAVMLVAHYDSVPEGPGAADDGAGLVVILEAIRALHAGPAIRNDLVVLFSDGEEARGLLGAQAFAAGHPNLADRIGVVVNLEARGSSGPALMFETSDHNGALIREFARSAPYPMATSLMAAIYKLLPNDTDFTPLKAAGLSGFNLAFLETYEAYHTRVDTIENLDPRSVQHLGANVLGFLRHFGNLALPLPKQPDLVYFNWFGTHMLVYPISLIWVTALLLPVLLIFGWVRSLRRELTIGRIAAGFLIFFLQLLIVLGGSFAAFALAKLIAGQFLEGDTQSNQLLFAGVMGIAFGLALISQRILGRRCGFANLAAGQLLAVWLLTLILCWFLVGGSYVLQWPVLFGIAGMFIAGRVKEPAQPFCHFLFLIPALLILVPLAYMFFVALNFTYFALAAAGFLLTVLMAMAPSLFDRLAGRLKLSVLVLFVVSTSLMTAGIRLSAWSATHPRRDTLIYSVNADENKAKWVSYDAAPDGWTSRVLGSTSSKQSQPSYTLGLDRPVLASDATLVPLAPPAISVEHDSTTDGIRRLKLQLTSARGARAFVVRLPAELELAAAGWNGKVASIQDSSPPKTPWTFRFYNVPPEGASLELRFRAQKPIRVWVADSTAGLPAIPPLSPRPNEATPGYGSDVTVVARGLEL